MLPDSGQPFSSFTSLQLVLCSMAVLKRLSVLRHSIDYNFISFGAIEILVTLKMTYTASQTT